nr:Trehalose-phosphate phosphatase [Streptococcus thermophilus]
MTDAFDPRPALDSLAHAEQLLVCVDFDGTICELHTDAYAVTPHPDAIAALEELSHMHDTTVAVLSGRHLDGLRIVCPLGAPVILVGSHGAEPTEGGPRLDASQRAYLDRVSAQLNEIINGHAPAFVENKPYQRVLHVAKLAESDPARAQSLIDAALALTPDTLHGNTGSPGHNVVEFSVVDTTKGTWLGAEKQKHTATLFAGDDVTDETALAVLDPAAGDVGIKIVRDAADTAAADAAAVDTAAQFLLRGVAEMADYLVTLAAARRSVLG